MSEHVIGGPLHVCETCPVRHYDNCPTCFGFGVRPRALDGETIPIRAGDPSGAVPCPTCGSTPNGVPKAKG